MKRTEKDLKRIGFGSSEQSVTSTEPPSDCSESFRGDQGVRPVLLLCHSPIQGEERIDDRIEFKSSLIVGRKPPSDFQVNDKQLSRTHFKISVINAAVEIEDLDSTNGTLINGKKLKGKCQLTASDVIRAGRCLFICQIDGEDIVKYQPAKNYGIVGRFHAGVIVSRLERFAKSVSNVLLVGPSGCGKELAAEALSTLTKRDMIRHNCGKFSSEEEATVTIFGVGKGVFTGVESKPGLLELSDGKMLFLDEAHNLTYRLQNSLLRVVEDWTVSRFGEQKERKIDVRLVLASNDLSETRGIKNDLYRRMREVCIPPLSERRADIPSLFNHLLVASFIKTGIKNPKQVLESISVEYYEALCLDGFENENVRGLRDITEDIVNELAYEHEPAKAIKSVFRHRYQKPLLFKRKNLNSTRRTPTDMDSQKDEHETSNSHSEKLSLNVDRMTLQLIEDAYTKCNGVVVNIVKYLKENHNKAVSPRLVSRILDAKNLPRLTRRRS